MARARKLQHRDWGNRDLAETDDSPLLSPFQSSTNLALGSFPQTALAPAHPGAQRVLSEERLDLIRRTAGVSVVEDGVKLTAVVDMIEAVSEHAGRMFKSGVQIGREFIVALRQLNPEEGARLVKASGELVQGLSAANVAKMIAAARLLDARWVDPALLPPAFSTLYELSLMNRSALEQAANRDLLTATMSRSAAARIRKLMVASPDADDHASGHRDPSLPHEVVEIDVRVEKLRSEIRQLLARRSRLMVKFSRPGPS